MITSVWAIVQGVCLVICALWLLSQGRSWQHFTAWFLLLVWWLGAMALQQFYQTLTPTYPLTMLGMAVTFSLCKLAVYTRGSWSIDIAGLVVVAMFWEFTCAQLNIDNAFLRLHLGAAPFYIAIIYLSFHDELRGITRRVMRLFGSNSSLSHGNVSNSNNNHNDHSQGDEDPR